MFFKIQITIFILLVLFSRVVKSGNEEYLQGGKCWNMTVDADWDKPAVVQEFQKQHVKHFWKNKALLVTSTMDELRQTLFLMLRSDSKLFRDTAFIHAVRMTAILINPIGSVPICQYTNIVNASVDMIKSKYKQSGKDALENLANSVGNTFSMIGYASMVNAKCDDMGELEPADESCYGHGLVFPIDAVLKHHARIFPCALRGILHTLYRSHLYIERINALILASSMTEYGQDLIRMHQPGPLFESLRIYTHGFNAECCDLINDRLEELNNIHSEQAIKNSQDVVKSKYTKQDGYGYRIRADEY